MPAEADTTTIISVSARPRDFLADGLPLFGIINTRPSELPDLAVPVLTFASVVVPPRAGARVPHRCGGAIADFVAWKAERLRDRANGGDPLPMAGQLGREATVLSRQTPRKKYRTACKVLGAERLDGLTIHYGRHAFISHALADGRTLAEVRDAAGHANVSITSTYLDVAVEDEGVGLLFG